MTRYNFNKPMFGFGGIRFPEKKRIDGYSLLEELYRKCQLSGLRFNRILMQINDLNGNKLAIIRNLGRRLEYIEYNNKGKGYLNNNDDIRIFVMGLK